VKILAMLVLGFSFMFGAVDINSASKSELMSLKGVGAKKADTILAYRASHCFKSIGELENVKGIGPKFILKNKANLEVGACKK
jgi:competence protein ComEA